MKNSKTKVQFFQKKTLDNLPKVCYNTDTKKRKEKIKMLKIVHVCPICDFTCPYCNANAECMLDNPYDECDDYAYAADEAGGEEFL